MIDLGSVFNFYFLRIFLAEVVNFARSIWLKNNMEGIKSPGLYLDLWIQNGAYKLGFLV